LGCETLRIPECLDNRLTDIGEVVSLTHRPRFILPEGSWYSFVRGLVIIKAVVRLEGLGKLKKIYLVTS
jgi:hypothetical protein